MLKTPSVSTQDGAIGAAWRRAHLAQDRAQGFHVAMREDLAFGLGQADAVDDLAWLSASLTTITAPSGARIGMTPVLHVKPDWKVSDRLDLLEFGQAASSSSWRLIVPAMVRTAPEPAP